MRDQSHKEEMSSLLQADFARLRARGIATTLAPAADQAPEPEAPVTPPVKPPAPVREPLPADSWLKRLLRTP
jgi:hypothetical protein